ncbi:Putative aminoacrylate hydrolase RutD (Aminohydrolase) [Durusdinium trenchii]|uniref:Aminoacrylate hydrolase RutD (Aminohydrolase) n=1 Tax=Durusdinium trenchii TaxID=1381693 RepID=A0ABP0LUB1_9DINO
MATFKKSLIVKGGLKAGLFAFCSTISLSAGGGFVLAQTETASTVSDDVIVVTARRRDESLLDVPIAVTAISGDQLAQQGVQDITYLSQSVPNLTLEVSRGTNSTLTAFIRGVGQQDPVAGFEAGVGIYVDDIYLNRPQVAVLDVYDVERIEVLRGPQGTLYGRNSVGGAVKYVTKRLGDDPMLRLRASGGTFGQFDIIGTAEAPLSDTLAVGGSVAYFSRNGFGENLTTGAENYNKDVLAFRASAEFDNDKVFVRLAGDYLKDDSNPKGGHRLIPGLLSGAPVLDDVFDSRGGITGENEAETYGAAMHVEIALNEQWTLKNIAAWRQDDNIQQIDFDALPSVDVDVPVIYENEQFTEELQLLYEGDVLAGVLGQTFIGGNTPPFGGTTSTLIATTSDFSGEETFTDFSPRVSLSWSPNGDHNLYASYSQGFKGGSFDPRGQSSAVTIDFDGDGDVDDADIFEFFLFEPEEVDSYEVGWKARFAEGRITSNLAVFYADYTNVQIPGSQGGTDPLTGAPTFIGVTTNAGGAEFIGVEWEGTALIAQDTFASGDSFSIAWGGGWIDADYTEFLVGRPMKKFLFAILVLIGVGALIAGGIYWQAQQGVSAAELEARYATSVDRFVDIAGARVRIREEGDPSAPPLVLIHGFTHSLETWDGWAEALKPEYRVIRYDLLGHGLTGPDPRQRYAPAERAAFLGDIFDVLGIKSAAVAGNSLGGLAAWRFASDNPERVNALILISPGAYPLNGVSDEPAEIPATMKAYLLTAPEAGVRASAELIYADDNKVTERRVAVMRDMIQRKGNGAAMIDSLEEFTLPDPSSALARIEAPTLILWGEGDILIPIEQGRQIEQAIPNAQLIAYPGVGHAAQEEAPVETVADAIAFLNDYGAVAGPALNK